MTERPKALWLADTIDSDFDPDWIMEEGYDQISAELRRLHEVNAELVEALRSFDTAAKDSASIIGFAGKAFPLLKKARAAIAKATGEQQ